MKTKAIGDCVVIPFPEGKLSDIGRRDFTDKLMELARAGDYRRIVVDFGRTQWLSSIDLGVFAFAAKECQQRNVSISIARANQRVRRVFETTNLDAFFPAFETVDDAVQA